MEIQYHEEYIINSRGIKLFTCRWLPLSTPKALVFLCHGYGCECSIFMRGTGIRLASAGYGVFGIDYEGHGKSKGKRCYIEKFSNIVNDCNNFFKTVCDSKEYRNKPRFLYGESMGGAVALLLHRKEPTFWNGAVLVAPMCKVINYTSCHFDLQFINLNVSIAATIFRPMHIWHTKNLIIQISENLKPRPFMVSILTKLSVFVPMWKIIPTKDIIDSAFKDPIKRAEIRCNELIYQDKPRVKTALEMLRVSMDLEDRLDEVTLPFLVLHGEEDTVTDPGVSQALYSTALSFDKTIKLYRGMWHGLTTGEPDENIDLVFSDIIWWLDNRIPNGQTAWVDRTDLQRPQPDFQKSHSQFPDKITSVHSLADSRPQSASQQRGVCRDHSSRFASTKLHRSLL